MKPLSASEILRRHVIERHLRAGIRSATLDGDPVSAEPRMSQSAWIASCALVAGVSEAALAMLTAFHCEHLGWHWETVLVEVQGAEREVRDVRAPIRLKLAQAAKRAGLSLDRAEARALQLEAIARVQDNLVARAIRAEGAEVWQ